MVRGMTFVKQVKSTFEKVDGIGKEDKEITANSRDRIILGQNVCGS
jgi:hypothetical protein